jgi:hypothetical protein
MFEYWNFSSLEYSSIGISHHWNIRVLEFPVIGMFEYWNFSSLEYSNIGILIEKFIGKDRIVNSK